MNTYKLRQGINCVSLLLNLSDNNKKTEYFQRSQWQETATFLKNIPISTYFFQFQSDLF